MFVFVLPSIEKPSKADCSLNATMVVVLQVVGGGWGESPLCVR